MTIDVIDKTFEAEVMVRSEQTPVVVDLWAPWCGPCKSLGPILERVVAETQDRVVLAKVDIDQNPAIAQAFSVQSIPAVFAIHKREVVGSFVGAQGEAAVREFVEKLLPDDQGSELDELVASGDESVLRDVLKEHPEHEGAVIALASLLAERNKNGDRVEAMDLIDGIPEQPATRRIAAMCRVEIDGDIESELEQLIQGARDDDEVRRRFLDLLEVMGPEDPRTIRWRQRLTSLLF